MQRSRRYQNLSDSQNFITNGKLIHRIIGLADFHTNDTVLEIGTGKGHLTEELCRKAGKVCSVEIDRKLYENAGKRLAQYSNLRLIYGDFLKYDLPSKGNYKVFANIPYFITTQIIDKLTQAPDLGKYEYYEFQKFLERSMKYGICAKGGPLTRRQVQAALKQAGLPHAHEDGVTLYIQWLCLFRCYRKMGKK